MSMIIIRAMQMLVIGIPAASFFLLSYLLCRKHRLVVSLSVGVFTAVIVFSICYLWPEPQNVRVDIQKPLKHDIVEGPWPTVLGSVTPPGAKVYVLVHPSQELRPSWWVQTPVKKGIRGAWKCEVNLGTEYEGKGEYFQLLAVVSTNPWFVDVVRNRWLRQGDRVSRPPPLPSSGIVTVWRKQ